MRDVGGDWESRRAYPGGESSHRLRIEDFDKTVFGESLSDREGSQLELELTRSGQILGGDWREQMSPTGEKGWLFRGFVAFVLNASGDRAEGKWIGYPSDEPEINSGDWLLERYN